MTPSLPGRDASDQQFSSLGTLTANIGTSCLVVSTPELGKAWHPCGPSNPVTGGLDSVPLRDTTLCEADPPGCTRGPIFEPSKVEDQTLGGDQFTKCQEGYTLHAPLLQVVFSGPLSEGGRSNAWTPPTGGRCEPLTPTSLSLCKARPLERSQALLVAGQTGNGSQLLLLTRAGAADLEG